MTLFILVDGTRREVIKVTPMMKLNEAVDAMLAKIGRGAEGNGGDYALTLKRKPVDAKLPVRFSGLQNRDTLDLRFTSVGSSSSQAKRPVPAAHGPAPHKQANSSPARLQGQNRVERERASSHSVSTSACGGVLEAKALSTDRGLIVFREDLIASSSSGERAESIPDDFYDFTAQDFAKLQQSKQALARQEEKRTLQTRAMRERERRQRAREMPPTRLRIVLPDRRCLQASFQATDKVSEVYAFVGNLLLFPDSDAFELFTTPPKSILSRKADLNLYDADLVPSARLYLAPGKVFPLTAGAAGGEQVKLKPWVEENFWVSGPPPVRAKEGGSGSVSDGPVPGPSRRDLPDEDPPNRPKKSAPKWFKL